MKLGPATVLLDFGARDVDLYAHSSNRDVMSAQ